MPWVKLDDAFWANPKVMAVGNEAVGAYVRILCYCGQHLTDGRIDDAATRLITKPSICKRLASHGLLTKTDAGWEIPDFLDFNPSKVKVEETRRKRAQAGRKGGKVSSNGVSK